jgi:hypothetical protein
MDRRSRLTVHFAAQAGQNAKLTEEEHIEVPRFVVAHQMSVPAGLFQITFDAENYLRLRFRAGGILDHD